MDKFEADIPRTYPEHPAFVEGDLQRLLLNVVTAFVNYRPEIGYHQGMTYIIGLLLMHLREREAFWAFVMIIKKYGLEHFYKKSPPVWFSTVITDFENSHPDLSAHVVLRFSLF